MATKTANVTARVQPEIKRQAEEVLDRIGLPVSVLIDALYRQIIMTGGVPFSLTVPKPPAKERLSGERFDNPFDDPFDDRLDGQPDDQFDLI